MFIHLFPAQKVTNNLSNLVPCQPAVNGTLHITRVLQESLRCDHCTTLPCSFIPLCNLLAQNVCQWVNSQKRSAHCNLIISWCLFSEHIEFSLSHNLVCIMKNYCSSKQSMQTLKKISILYLRSISVQWSCCSFKMLMQNYWEGWSLEPSVIQTPH